jgi:hypothetical protein
LPAAPTHLVFGQQPTNATAGAALSPSVTVRLLDQFNNLVTTDNTDRVTIALASNPGGATLSGSTTVTVSGGVATFSNLSLNQVGTGYTLAVSSGSLSGTTSAPFTITAAAASSPVLIEGFEGGSTYYVVGSAAPTVYLSTAAAHDGTYGLDNTSGNDWIYRNDAAAQVKQGDSISAWVKFANYADGRAYFGFGASATGTLSVVLAPNTSQLILLDDSGYNYANLNRVTQYYQPNQWYRVQVDWGGSGTITARLFDSNGTTQLNSVTAVDRTITSGGIAFRAFGSDKYFDTITVNRGVVSSMAQQALVTLPGGSSSAGSSAGSIATSSGSKQISLPPSKETVERSLAGSAIDRIFAASARETRTLALSGVPIRPWKEGDWLQSLFGER